METTFMTIHNLSPEANILFASESIYEILDYRPFEVVGKSCFDYFHQDDIPLARYGHQRSLKLDKAAVLYYARINTKYHEWITCECVFTVAYDVLVACTSVYRGDLKSHQRNAEAKKIRRLFSSPPRDPRYHMLEHLTPKFTAPIELRASEPRAVLILNRFSRTLPIMYASDSITAILGITQPEIRGKSFYECIQENCLDLAIPCLERAKANDSIAYLRFYYRNPGQLPDQEELDREANHSSDSEDGGVPLENHLPENSDMVMEGVENNETPSDQSNQSAWESHSDSRANSGGSSDLDRESTADIFDRQPQTQSQSTSSSPPSSGVRGRIRERRVQPSYSAPAEPIEVEAVISCSSDGLVVILRAAPLSESRPAGSYTNGLFAAPWAANPIIPQNNQSPTNNVEEPPPDFMTAIRDVAVFAWALTGINGNIADYSHGNPTESAVPPLGFPLWDPQANVTNYFGPENNSAKRRAQRERTRMATNTSGLPYSRPNQEETFRNQKTNAMSPKKSLASDASLDTETGLQDDKQSGTQNSDVINSDRQSQG